MNSLPKTVTRLRRGCDLNPGPPEPEFSTLTTRLLSHHICRYIEPCLYCFAGYGINTTRFCFITCRMWIRERILGGAFSRIERLPHKPPVKRGKSSPFSITERRVPELIPVLCSRPAGDVNHKPGVGLSLLSARPAVTPATFNISATNVCF